MRRVYSFYEGGGSYSGSRYRCTSSECIHCDKYRDCDGDSISVCNYSGYCPSKSVRRDCDGDPIQICMS